MASEQILSLEDGSSRPTRIRTKTKPDRTTLSLEAQSLLRGAKLSSVLEGCGSHFRLSAGGIAGSTTDDAEDNYDKSFPVDELDVFLSHSWHANWLCKYVTLLFHFSSLSALVTSQVVTVVVMRMIGQVLPPQAVLAEKFCRIGCLLVTFCGCMAYMPYMKTSSRLFSNTSVFLDKICVHQTDEKLKAAGIRSFGAILSHTSQMLVAWDRSYFKRLWCTYELAAFRHARPSNPVTVLPCSMGAYVAILCAFRLLFVELAYSVICTYTESGSWRRDYASYVLSAAQVSFVAFTFQRYAKDLRELQGQLEAFSEKNAECYCCSCDHVHPDTGAPISCDRKLVYESIAHWYGAGDLDIGLRAFDRMAREKLLAETAGLFDGLPYVWVLCMSIYIGQLVARDLFLMEPRKLELKLYWSYLFFLENPAFIAVMFRASRLLPQRLRTTSDVLNIVFIGLSGIAHKFYCQRYMRALRQVSLMSSTDLGFVVPYACLEVILVWFTYFRRSGRFECCQRRSQHSDCEVEMAIVASRS